MGIIQMTKTTKDVMYLSEMRRSLLSKGAKVVIGKSGPLEGKSGVVEKINGRTGIVRVKLEDDTVHELRHSNLRLCRQTKEVSDVPDGTEPATEAVQVFPIKMVRNWAKDATKTIAKYDKYVMKYYGNIGKLFSKLQDVKDLKKELTDEITALGYIVAQGRRNPPDFDKIVAKMTKNISKYRMYADEIEDECVSLISALEELEDRIDSTLSNLYSSAELE